MYETESARLRIPSWQIVERLTAILTSFRFRATPPRALNNPHRAPKLSDTAIHFLAVTVTLSEDGAPQLRREVLPLEIGYLRVELRTAKTSCHVVIDTTAESVVLSTAGLGEAEVELDFLVCERDQPPIATDDAESSICRPRPSTATANLSRAIYSVPSKPCPPKMFGLDRCPIEAWAIGDDVSAQTVITDGSGRIFARPSNGRTPASEPIQLPLGRYLLRSIRSRGMSIARIACAPHTRID